MMRCVLLAAALAASLGCSPNLSPTTTVYGPTPHELADEDAPNVHSIELEENRSYLVQVDQGNGDMTLEVRSPDGEIVTKVANPLGRGGPETLLIDATITGNYQLSVWSAGIPRAQQYRLTVDRLSSVTRDDQRRLDAERAMTAGAQLNLQAGARSRAPEEVSVEPAEIEAIWAKSIEEYLIAHSLWKRLRQTTRRARALHSTAALRYQLMEWKHTAKLANKAATLYNDDEAAAAKALQLQGEALLETQEKKDFQSALVALNEAMKKQSALGNQFDEAMAINSLGLAYRQQGNLDTARRYFVRANEAFDQLGERQQAIWALNNIALADYGSGNVPSAIETYEEALALAGSQYALEKANVLMNLAVAHRILGNLQEALIRYDEAAAMYDRLGDRSGQARALQSRGRIYGRLGDWEKALSFVNQVQNLLKNRPAESGLLVGMQMDIGLAQRHLGQPEKARDAHKKALDLAKVPAQEARAHLELGRDYLAMEAVDKARDHFGRALAAATTEGAAKTRAFALQERGQQKILLPDSIGDGLVDLQQALESHRALSSEVGEAQTLHALARAKQMLGRVTEASEHASDGLAIIERLRVRIGSPLLRLSYTGLQLPTYEMHIALLMELHKSGASGYIANALEVSERARARSLVELLHEAQTETSQGLDSELLQNREDKQNTLLFLANQLEVTSDPDKISSVRPRIQAIQTDLDLIEEKIRKQNQAYAELTQPPRLSAADIQRLLTRSAVDEAETVLLEYSLGDQRSFLWCVTEDSIESWTLPSRSEIEFAAREAYDHFKTASAGRTAKQAELAAATRLSELVLSPVIDRLDGRRIVVVPDGALQYIPFGALPIDASGTRLIALHEIVTLPSISTLALLRSSAAGRSVATKTVAIFADPVFEKTDLRLSGQRDQSERVATRGPANTQYPQLHRLPATGKEADAISRLAPASQVLTMTGFAASRDNVLNSSLSDYRLVHFATHGLINADYPELSALGLSAYDRNGKEQRSFLRLTDIYGLNLNAELVVLSACEAHLGEEIRGEGLVGLTRGFMYAGAPRVVASLWLASDKATAELMQDFYRLMLNDNLRPADALRRAQLSTAEKSEWSHPFFWAGFTLQGDWR